MGFDGSVGSAVEAQKWTSKIPLTGDVNGMNDFEEEEEEEGGVVPFLTRAKYMLVYEYSHVSTRRAQRTVIDVIVRGNWLPSSHKTAACCAG